jgi:hypothetical protein
MHRLISSLEDLGFTFAEIHQLRRIEMTLTRWSEHECNGEIERNETTGKPERVSAAWIAGVSPKRFAYPIADREAGALKRLAAIVKARNDREVVNDGSRDVLAYHQTDPRGVSLYLVRKSDVPEGKPLDQFYTRGIAVAA